jgi:hypothetical protein
MKKTVQSIALGLGVVGLSLSACGGSGGDEETAPAATAAPAPAPAPAAPEEPAGPPHLKFAEMTVYEGTTAIFKIHADGKTEVAAPPAAAGGQPTWSAGPQVAPDGTITFKQQKVARVEQDGTIKNLRSNQVVPVKVGQDTLTAQAGGQEVVLQIKEDGAITVPGAPPDKQLRVEGAADAESRRTAMALLGAIFLSAKVGQQQQQAPGGAAPAPGGQPAPGGAAPAPGGAQPAPGGAAPAPGGAAPAPGGAAPAPGGAAPAQPTPPPKPTK